ncbi:MAG: hypothetical protein EWV44_04095 [Microcystis flos-aquae Mf_QC_C_20070823_S20T]|nr:MAG: hypothetical protein EWV44_04095 [Microcystis flos-aquae Mf_QC_C_20070823_S20T]
MPNLAVEFNLIEDIAGTPGGLLNQNNPLNIGDRFFVQVLMRDIHSNPIGLTGSAINLNFEANKIQNIDIPFNPVDDNSPLVTSNFTLFRGGNLNNINGTITELGGASLPSASLGSLLGLNQPEQFSLMHFQVIGKGSSNLILNVDLSQTNFADDRFIYPTRRYTCSQETVCQKIVGCVFAAINSVKKTKLTSRCNAPPLSLNWCVTLLCFIPYRLIFVSLWL